MTDVIRSQIRRKAFGQIFRHSILLCFVLEYTMLMLDEYWGNFPIEYLLVFLQAALFCAALKTGPAPRQRPQKLLPRLWPVPLTAAVLILVYVLLPGRLWLVSSRVWGTALFLLGAFYWNRARSGDAAFLLNLYACALAVHLCYLPAHHNRYVRHPRQLDIVLCRRGGCICVAGAVLGAVGRTFR